MKEKRWWIWLMILLAVGGLTVGIAAYAGQEEKIPGGTLVKNQMADMEAKANGGMEG